MDKEKRKELIRKFGPACINLYVHDACEPLLESFVSKRNEVIAPASRKTWRPLELIGRWHDIDRCDICDKIFQPSDTGYVSIASMSPDEFELWKEVEKEPK
jgi:hypothetical protein